MVRRTRTGCLDSYTSCDLPGATVTLATNSGQLASKDKRHVYLAKTNLQREIISVTAKNVRDKTASVDGSQLPRALHC